MEQEGSATPAFTDKKFQITRENFLIALFTSYEMIVMTLHSNVL